MNCQGFIDIVNELAAYELMDAGTRDAGRSHASICYECATRLSVAQSVTNGLLIAAGAEIEEAPVLVRQTLLAQFVAQHATRAEQPPEVEAAPLLVVEISGTRLPWWFALTGVAAAAMLLIALVPASWWRVAPPRPVAEVIKPNDTPPSPSPQPSSIPLSAVTGARDKKSGGASGTMARKMRGKVPEMARGTRPLRNSNAKSEPSTVAGNSETAGGQYFPLTYLDSATAMESGTVVRIELSRAALISLGLPLNLERTDELVKADLVVGDDGVARAIRLVQK